MHGLFTSNAYTRDAARAAIAGRNHSRTALWRAQALLTSAAFALAACHDVSGPVQPAAGDALLAVANPGAPAGFFEICKIAGENVAEGDPFQFTLSGPNVVANTINVPAGGCSTAIQANAGPVTVTEVAQPGVTVDLITFFGPGAAASSFNLATRVATVQVIAGGVGNTTIVNFRNKKGFGFVKVCKIGTGAVIGTNFGFTFGGAAAGSAGFSLVAGAGGEANTNCDIVGGSQNPTLFPAGDVVTITEGASATSVISGVQYQGAGSSVLSNRTASVTLGAGENIVTFTNVPPPSTGTLQVCKVGTGAAIGANFQFAATGIPGNSPVNVAVAGGAGPTGNCTPIDGPIPIGTVVTVTEAAAPGFQLTSIVGGTVDLANRRSAITIAAGQNTVTFTNVPAPVVPLYPLQVCKVAGTGVAVGTNFSFVVDALPSVTVAAGPAPTGTCQTVGQFAAGTVVPVTENALAGFAVSNIVISGAATGSVNIANRAASVTIGAGTNTVTFTNVSGTLQLCKIAGNPGAVGQSFSFTNTLVAGTTNVTAASAPGNCVPIGGQITPGTNVSVTEQPIAGFIVLGNQYTRSITIAAGLNTITFTNFKALRECNRTQGFFSTHGVNNPGNQANVVQQTLDFGTLTGSPLVSGGQLVVGGSTLGGSTLTAAEINTILDANAKGGNAEIILLQQLIAAELNVIAQGVAATPPGVLTDIAAAQAILSGGISDAERATALAIAGRLDAFNNSDQCS
jgi:hypothetical protein